MSGKKLSMTRLDSGRRTIGNWSTAMVQIAHGRMLLTPVGRPHVLSLVEEKEAVRKWVEKNLNVAIPVDALECED
jgi:hypothetical protein